MKAAALFGARDLRVIEVPYPSPTETQILLKVEACGICGSDLRMWREGPLPGQTGVIPGHEVAGVIVFVGSKTSGKWREGEKIALAADVNCAQCYYCQRGMYNLCENKKIIGRDIPGGLAEYMVLNEEILERGIIHGVPEGLSASEAAMAEPLASVIHLQRRLNIGPGTSVVVFGAGPIGCLHVELVKMRGAEVILVEIDKSRLEYVRNIVPADYFATNPSETADLIYNLTQGVGVDIAIVACPSASAQAQAVELARKGGTVVLFGGLPSSNPYTTLNANIIHYREIQILGAFSYCPWDHKDALRLLATRKINIQKYITEFDLQQASEVFALLADPESNKRVIKGIIVHRGT